MIRLQAKDQSMNGFPMSPPCLLVCLMINNQHTTVKDNYLKRAIQEQ